VTRALEDHIAHLSRTVEDLSEVVARQDAEIAVLQRRVQMLMARQGARDGDGGAAVFGDERPPHW